MKNKTDSRNIQYLINYLEEQLSFEVGDIKIKKIERCLAPLYEKKQSERLNKKRTEIIFESSMNENSESYYTYKWL